MLWVFDFMEQVKHVLLVNENKKKIA